MQIHPHPPRITSRGGLIRFSPAWFSFVLLFFPKRKVKCGAGFLRLCRNHSIFILIYDFRCDKIKQNQIFTAKAGRKMKFSVSSYSYSGLTSTGKKTEAALIALAAEMGFDGIEFAEIHPPAGMDKTAYAASLRAEAQRVGIPIVAYCIGANLLGDTDAEIERLKAEVDIAAAQRRQGPSAVFPTRCLCSCGAIGRLPPMRRPRVCAPALKTTAIFVRTARAWKRSSTVWPTKTSARWSISATSFAPTRTPVWLSAILHPMRFMCTAKISISSAARKSFRPTDFSAPGAATGCAALSSGTELCRWRSVCVFSKTPGMTDTIPWNLRGWQIP